MAILRLFRKMLLSLSVFFFCCCCCFFFFVVVVVVVVFFFFFFFFFGFLGKGFSPFLVLTWF